MRAIRRLASHSMKPAFFKSSRKFHLWLEDNHATTREFLVGFHKKSSGKGGLTHAEAVDELLCFGWIDGAMKRVGDESYAHRVTPRRPGSIWSKVNVGHVARLVAAGRMRPAGLRAFAARKEHRTGIYSYERGATKPRARRFPPAMARIFRANLPAWTYWQTQPPGYQRTAIWWVTSAKRPETRQARLSRLITIAARGRRLAGK